MPKSSREKEAQWRSSLRRQQESGLGIRQFCREQRLSEPSFYAWRREIARRDRQAAVKRRQENNVAERRQRPRQGDRTPANGALFVPLRLTNGNGMAGPIELVHPRGHVVRIPAGCDMACLRAVLGLLDQ